MVEEISILIVDDNIEFGNLLHEYLKQQDQIHVAGVARDGLEAIEMIKSKSPDVVILDIVMPSLDGIGVLERVSGLKLVKKPIFIVLSAVGQDMFTQKAMALGAEYYMVKPCDIEVLLSRIREIYKDKSSTQLKFTKSNPSLINIENNAKPAKQLPDLELEVTNLMHAVGIPPHMIGYQYLREAIIQSSNSQRAFTSVTKILYPEVAKKFESTPQKVERAIRNAIETAWARGKVSQSPAIFGGLINFSKDKPTNSEFIAMMADRIKVELKIK
jgi:two-component system response regulator (stage 0 sporulation protein A)